MKHWKRPYQWRDVLKLCDFRFSINYFTAIGLGYLTEELREWLKTAPPPAPTLTGLEDGSSSSSSSSSSDSSSSSSGIVYNSLDQVALTLCVNRLNYKFSFVNCSSSVCPFYHILQIARLFVCWFIGCYINALQSMGVQKWILMLLLGVHFQSFYSINILCIEASGGRKSPV